MTAWQVTVQSAAIHPTWNAQRHAHYLMYEAVYENAHVAAFVVNECYDDALIVAAKVQAFMKQWAWVNHVVSLRVGTKWCAW